jgi:hypothetical protein
MNLILDYHTRVAKQIGRDPTIGDRVYRGSLAVDRKHEEYALRCAEAELEKTALRWKYHQAEANLDRDRYRRFDYEAKVRRMVEMWSEYEEINRRLIPEDPVYSGVRAGVALSTANDHFTCTSAASGQTRALEVFIGGEATASAVARVGVYNSSSGATPTNQTPEKFSTRSPAAAGTYATAWTTQPTLNAQPVFIFAFNAFGGGDKWIAQPGSELYIVNAEKFSCRSASGTSTVSSHVIFEEL